MFMQPIVVAKAGTRKPRAAALKVAAGAVSLPFMAVAIVAYWAVAALWLTAGCAAQLARGSYDCLLFMGGELIGH